MNDTSLISIRELSIYSAGRVLVNRFSIDIEEGEILGIAGESGSGKTMAFRALMNILPAGVSYSAERIRIFGTDCTGLPIKKLRLLIARHIGWIPQNTMASLHPDIKIGGQLADAYVGSNRLSRTDILNRAELLLLKVGFSSPGRILSSYPWQLSGGMRQRVNIAMALINEPRLLIADEPTTALDAAVARQTLRLIMELHTESNITVVIISHSLNMLRQYTMRTAVMYAGSLMELGKTNELFHSPEHPYSKALLSLSTGLSENRERLPEIPGLVPDSGRDKSGCIFAPRCPHALPLCAERQHIRELKPGHLCLCSRAPLKGVSHV